MLTRRLPPGRAQDGVALISAVIVLSVLTVTAVALIEYTGASSRTASYGKQSSVAFSLAEAGISEAMAILSNPENNALNPSLLPLRTSTYSTGTVTWAGSLDQMTATWTVGSTGRVRNPTGPAAADLERTLAAKVVVTPSLAYPANSPVWNYIWSTRTGNACDMTIQQSVQVATPVYAEGNLCLQNTAQIVRGPLVVKGKLTLFRARTPSAPRARRSARPTSARAASTRTTPTTTRASGRPTTSTRPCSTRSRPSSRRRRPTGTPGTSTRAPGPTTRAPS